MKSSASSLIRSGRRLALPWGLMLSLLVPAGLSVAPSSAEAGTRVDGDARVGLIHELRSLNRSLRLARLNFERHARLDREDAIEALNDAQIAFFREDYVLAVLRLVELTGQESFKDHPGYGEALTYLAEALWHLGMESASSARFKEALGQRALPSAYRHTLSRYLTVAGSNAPIGDLQRFWDRYQSLRGDAELETEDRDIRYQYAKALYGAGRLSVARAMLEQIGADEADPHRLKALYFVGVVYLRDDHQVKAIEAFESALEVYDSQLAAAKAEKPPTALPEAGFDLATLESEARAHKGPEQLEVIALDGEDIEPEADPQGRFEAEMAALAAQEGTDEEAQAIQTRDHVGHLTALALGRLHAARGDFAKSWRHYRRVLVLGSPEETAALAEASFVLSKRGDFDWSRRLVDRQLRRRSEDLSSARLRLWRAQLMAQATQYEAAESDYKQMEQALQKRADQLAADLGADPRMFPEALLAWSAPEDARYMRTLETDLILQSTELESVQGLLEEISALAKTQGALPSVARGREIHKGLEAQLAAFENRLKDAEAAARQGPPRSGVPSGRLTAVAPEAMPAFTEIRRSTERLRGRLGRFATALDRYERDYRNRITRTLSEESPRLARLGSQLKAQSQSAEALAGDLRSVAQSNLDRYVGEAQFGQVNLAWWRKWEISQRIKAASAEVQAADAEMREALSE
ncbi:MAG: tetratricopeptide repeat protein [Bradymonadia bacterium]